MKFSKYFMLAGAAAMLTACSSEEPFVGPDNNFADLADVETYATFNISMPSTGTRAGLEDYTPGTAAEYAIKTGQVLIFGLPTEGNANSVDGRVQAKFLLSAPLEFSSYGSASGQYDAANAKAVAKFPKGTFAVSSFQKYYGVCLLNAPADWVPNDGQTFQSWVDNADLNGVITNVIDGTTYYVMSNAALYNATATENLAKGAMVLTEIDRDNVRDLNESLENVGPAGTFTVSRLAAKVEFANAASKETTKDVKVTDNEGNESTIGSVKFTNWAMDVTRKSTNPVQVVWGDNMNVFYSDKATNTQSWFFGGTPARCHWADGRTYKISNEDIKKAGVGEYFNLVDDTKLHDMNTTVEYVRENTRHYTLMSKGSTTRMIVKATYTPSGIAENSDLINIKYSDKGYYTPATLKEAAENVCAKYTDLEDAVVTVSAGVSGWKTIDKVLTVTTADGDDLKDGQLDRIYTDLGIFDKTADEVCVYAKGVCYYAIYINHFAADQDKAGHTPTPGLTPSSVYNKVEYEGRYSIVRNNWYEVNVTGVSGIGSPTIPAPDPDKPVDEADPEDDSYRHLNVVINILNWTKRSQDVVL